jgi:hypothetical protein
MNIAVAKIKPKPVCLMPSDKRACDGLVNILDIFKRDAGVILSDYSSLRNLGHGSFFIKI